MGDILDHLRVEHQRAVRAEADADRLAEQVGRLMCACEPGNADYRCSKCVVLDLHDREVEAR